MQVERLRSQLLTLRRNRFRCPWRSLANLSDIVGSRLAASSLPPSFPNPFNPGCDSSWSQVLARWSAARAAAFNLDFAASSSGFGSMASLDPEVLDSLTEAGVLGFSAGSFTLGWVNGAVFCTLPFAGGTSRSTALVPAARTDGVTALVTGAGLTGRASASLVSTGGCTSAGTSVRDCEATSSSLAGSDGHSSARSTCCWSFLCFFSFLLFLSFLSFLCFSFFSFFLGASFCAGTCPAGASYNNEFDIISNWLQWVPVNIWNSLRK